MIVYKHILPKYQNERMMKQKSKKYNEILHEVDKLLENRRIDA